MLVGKTLDKRSPRLCLYCHRGCVHHLFLYFYQTQHRKQACAGWHGRAARRRKYAQNAMAELMSLLLLPLMGCPLSSVGA